MSVYDAFEYVMNHYVPYGIDISEALENDTYAIISIQDKQSKGFGIEFKESRSCLKTCTLYFDDVYKRTAGTTAFNKTTARKVLDFVESVKDEIDTLVIHCYAGQSRSYTIGRFLYDYGYTDDFDAYNTGSINPIIYETLGKCLNNKKSDD